MPDLFLVVFSPHHLKQNCIISTKFENMSTNKEPKWIDSQAKAHLLDLIMRKQVTAEMKPKDVYDRFCKDREEFKPFLDYKNFSNRLRALRTKVEEKNDGAERDAAALARDREICPRPLMDGFGLPHWPDAEAKALLESDIENEKHIAMSKEGLWSSRPEHMECFPFDVFVKHVHQEAKTRKFHTCCKDKADEKINKQFLCNMPSNVK